MAKYITVNTTSVRNDDGSFTISFVELPITTEGDTFEEAQDNALEAMAAFMTALLENELLEMMLNQCGVDIHDGEPPTEWVPPKVRTGIGALLAGHHHALPVYA